MRPEYLKAMLGPNGCITTALAEGESMAFRVVGGCMEPDFRNQTWVLLERPEFFVPGDVVAFHCSKQNRLLVHRFLGYIWRRGTWKLMLMADRGICPDPLADASAVLGRVIAQGGRSYRITPTKRLEALWRYVLWCVRRLRSYALRWRSSDPKSLQ